MGHKPDGRPVRETAKNELSAVKAAGRPAAAVCRPPNPRTPETRPVLFEAARAAALPQSALAKACHYTLTLWGRLTRFLDYSEVELSNNVAENSMRPVALGRRNWIHLGSKEAGPRVANILSVVETCRRMALPVREYLASVLPGLADLPVQRAAELTPRAWATARTGR